MARKVLNRKVLREEAEAAEKADAGEKAVKKKKTTTKKRVTRTKEPTVIRKKVFWGVFSQSLKRVATFEFDQKADAVAKAQALSQSGKSPHFVQKVKEVVED